MSTHLISHSGLWSRPQALHPRQAFTLFEVSISLVLVAFGVVSVLMLFPTGLKAQQMARLQILAAAKAEEMIESFVATNSSNPAIDTEGLTMWDVPSSHRSQTWDLEARLSSHRFGLMPIPPDIAKRLDSDGGELEAILAQGGYLYYSQPMATTNLEEQGLKQAPPNEAQRLVIGISGYAQQNALHLLTLKNWPYHTPWPSPPLHTMHMADRFLPERVYNGNDYWNYYVWPWKDIYRRKMGVQWVTQADGQIAVEYPLGTGINDRNWVESHCYPWETTPQNGDPHIQKVFDWKDKLSGKHVGYFPYACGRLWEWEMHDRPKEFHSTLLSPNEYGEYPSADGALRYVASTLWYAKQHGFGAALWDNPGANPHAAIAGAEDTAWKEVQAMRFLAHATTCLTAWFSYSNSVGGAQTLDTGVRIPQVNLAGVTSPENVVITHEKIRYYHERSLALINQYAARFPYDWRIPRPLNRVTMMDFPLLQADLFSPPQARQNLPPSDLYNRMWRGESDNNADYKKLYGRDEQDDPQQWRPIAGEPIRHLGVSSTYPTSALDASQPDGGSPGYGPHFGNYTHFNLTAPFAAAERCREIVMWAVDWQSYEDVETAASAPVDASKYPLGSPRGDWHSHEHKHSSATEIGEATPNTRHFNERMWDVEFRDEQLWAYRNPEKVILFYPLKGVDPRTLPTGSDVEKYMVLNNAFGRNDGGETYPDKGPEEVNREVFNGLYGADRNFNRKLDRGPVPRSVRMHATPVARFNFYDPRVQAVLR